MQITELDTAVKLAIYRWFAETASRPEAAEIAATLDLGEAEVAAAYGRLRLERVLLLEDDGRTIRMAPPFSGVPTQHIAEVAGKRYFANCAWDALGIPAALKGQGIVHSRCEQSREPLRLVIGPDGPEPSAWLFHSAVEASHWWDNIVFT